MKSLPLLSRAVVIIASLLAFVAPHAEAVREEHSMMHAASDAIKAAQGSANPVENLEKARQHLHAAKDNKRGYRAEAIKAVDEAIVALGKGKRVEADKLMKQALSAIEKGVALHPRDRRPKRTR